MGLNILRSLIISCLISLLSRPVAAQPAAIQTPTQFLGFEVGADRVLADYHQIVSYFRMLASRSNKIEVRTIGTSTLGNDMIMAMISSEENLKNKELYRSIAQSLTDPRGKTQTEIDALVERGKTVVLVTCNIHSTEIGSTQMVLEWAYALVTATDAETKRRLDNVILLLVPSLNPDGQLMEVEWYRKYVGTKYEGGRMPWLYHPYVGHDNNRDWYMLTQKESQAVTRMVYHEWFPQVWLDEHQMGSTGPRMFVPPFSSPIADNIHPLIFREADHFGTSMSWRLEQNRKSGVVYGAMFDAYWPGSTKSTAFWKNICGLLTEVASTRMGTPIELNPGELSGGGKGLAENRKQANFPNPWPGGTWRIRDIMDYERIASDALLEACANNRKEILRGMAMKAVDAIQLGAPDEYYRIPMKQRDPSAAAHLALLMRENGVEVLTAEAEQTYYIPTAQPYSRFLVEMLGVQRYPKVRLSSGGSVLAPYDVTAWSLPLLMGVQVDRMKVGEGQRASFRPLRDTDRLPGSVTNASAQRFIIAPIGNSVSRLVNRLVEKKAAVGFTTESASIDGHIFPSGSIVVEKASDLEAWTTSLSLQAIGIPAGLNVPTKRITAVRLGMYKPWSASLDEGWTRWLLEQYEFPLKSLTTKDMRDARIIGSLDVVILPDVSKEIIVEGRDKRGDGEMKYTRDLPPEYAGGIAKEGVKVLKDFVEQGGTLIASMSSCEFVFDEFNIPVSNALASVKSEDFNCPGSLLRMNVDTTHPVTAGIPSTIAAFLDEKLAFRTAPPGPEMTREVLAWYPDEAEDMLLSGWIQGAEKLQKKAAAVALTYGKGKIVLFGFRVLHRAQAEGTFKLFFNAIHWGAASSQ